MATAEGMTQDTARPKFYVCADAPDARKLLANELCTLIQGRGPLLFVCIGTDRYTGDVLGPLVGTRLVSLGIDRSMVYGTLDSPVHAENLHDVVREINGFWDSYIVAVDAFLGSLDHVGTIVAARGRCRPGIGVGKSFLPEVGDVYIGGIVNVGGYLEDLILQNTELSRVMIMAEVIATAIADSVRDQAYLWGQQGVDGGEALSWGPAGGGSIPPASTISFRRGSR